MNRELSKQTVPSRFPERGLGFDKSDYFLRAGFRFETTFRKPVVFRVFNLEARFGCFEEVFVLAAGLAGAGFTVFLALLLPRKTTAIAVFSAAVCCSSVHPCVSLTEIIEARMSRHVSGFSIVALENMRSSA